MAIVLSLGCTTLAAAHPPGAQHAAGASHCGADRIETVNDSHRGRQSLACIDGRRYALALHTDGAQIRLTLNKQRPLVLHRFGKTHDPSLAGGERRIGFLPLHLQPYLEQGHLMYLSAVRSTGGAGTGQCGAGLEVYLHALDIRSAKPRSASATLIDSCLENIELAGKDETDNLGRLKVVDGRLQVEFAFYYDNLDPAPALLSNDFKRLEWQPAAREQP